MTNKEKRFQLGVSIVMGLIAVTAVLPLILLVMASFTSNQEIILNGYSFFPKVFSLEAYQYIYNERAQIISAYGITLIVTVTGVSVGLLLTVLYAYVLSKPQLPGKHFCLFICF